MSNDAVVLEIFAELRGRTISVAESLTGGLVCAALTDVAGASEYVRGGITVYATDLKHTLVGVDADLLDREGPVSPRVATQMASGVAAACSSTFGLALTGVAGPDPQSGHKPGLVYLACVELDGTGKAVRHEVREILMNVMNEAPRDRAGIRAESVSRALQFLLNFIKS